MIVICQMKTTITVVRKSKICCRKSKKTKKDMLNFNLSLNLFVSIRQFVGEGKMWILCDTINIIDLPYFL